MHLFMFRYCPLGQREFVSKTYCGLAVTNKRNGLLPILATEETLEKTTCKTCLNSYMDHMEKEYRKAHAHLQSLEDNEA